MTEQPENVVGVGIESCRRHSRRRRRREASTKRHLRYKRRSQSDTIESLTLKRRRRFQVTQKQKVFIGADAAHTRGLYNKTFQ